jgi:uncharacterized membrane protein
MSILLLVMRWAHILAAITAVGGILFMRFVLAPSAAAVLDDATHQKLRAAILKRWQHVVHTCILLFLVSGLYNYLTVTQFLHPDQPIYHMLFGIKFILAIVVFALALGLTSTRGWAEPFRKNTKLWTSVLAGVAVVVVAISGILRALPESSTQSERAAVNSAAMDSAGLEDRQ